MCCTVTSAPRTSWSPRTAGLSAWLETDPADDLTRAELADPVLLAAGRLIDGVLPTAYFVADPSLIAWLALQALRIWIEHGPSRSLIGSVGHAAYHAGVQGGDYPAGYRVRFGAALREVARRQRPWHQALIAERAARFYLAHGIEHVGHDLLAQAREAYAAWGATAKVTQLDWAHPTLEAGSAGARAGQPVTTGTLDLFGILASSQALSSETSLERLRSRVVEVLSAMTGATGVHLLLWPTGVPG